MTKNKKWIGTVILLLVLLCGWMAWSKWASTTRIGLVNFQNFQTTSLIKSNEDQFIKYEEVPLEELGRLDRYDFVLGFGMGLRMTAGQRDNFKRLPIKELLFIFMQLRIRKIIFVTWIVSPRLI